MPNAIGQVDNSPIEVVRYYGAHEQVMFVPSKKNLVLADVPNPLGRCPVFVAMKP